jgi:DNA polymerase-3 subunit epsilon
MPLAGTLLQEEALLRRHGRIIEPGALRLQDCRSRYNLLHFHGHNALLDALLDALATAELLIAMAAHRSVGETFSVSELS